MEPEKISKKGCIIVEKVYIVYGRSDSYRDVARCYTWIEGAFYSFEKAKAVFLEVFAKSAEWFGLTEEDFGQPIFHGSHGSAYLDGGDAERWLELVEAEIE